MTAKKLVFGHDVRTALKKGADTVTDAVCITLGPCGKNVAMDKGFGSPSITNDGVSIAKEISLKDPFENMGVQIVKEVANKTNDRAGDGTTTAMVLTRAILDEGFKRTAMGANVLTVKRGIEKAASDAVVELHKMAKDVKGRDEIRNIAIISAESKELGKEIADTINKVGKDGVVTVEESQSFGITSEIVDGFEFNKGYISPYMVTDPSRMEAEMRDASILVTDKKISSIQDILPLLEKLAQAGKKDLVIIAEDVDGEALATFVVNKLRGSFNVLAIKSPGYGDGKKESLKDIALLVGTEVISEETGKNLKEIPITLLGTASRIVSSKDTTIIVGGKGKKKNITERVTQLQTQLQTVDSKFDREKLEERIAKLTEGVAVIRVGAATETEMKYLKDKIEDAVNATKAAIDEGIIQGGGSALVLVADKLSKNKDAQNEDELAVGYRVLLHALRAPLIQIIENTGRDDASVIIQEILNKGNGFGFDASGLESKARIVNMFSEGIIDPVKVTRSGVENAASAAAALLTTQVAIADDIQDSDTPPMNSTMGGGMPMGM